ncbi:MAG TPA: NUDIX hydrolase [Stellaceae bacterium]|nr:NUDIX hydrolase [Stellaceae bacterium]
MVEPAIPLPAATLLLLRDGAAGLEVLMTLRHEKSGFAAGALVFPGGKLDAADAALRRFCPPALGGAADLPFRIAAIRETFEESGILLARSRDGALLDRAGLSALQKHHDEAGEPPAFAALLEAAGLELAADTLVRYAHWVTPIDRPKRFDTQFFLAPAPPAQEPAHDGREIVEAVWTTPEAALRDAEAGRIKLVFATQMNLVRLARSRTIAEALDRARREPIVTVTPEVVKTASGTAFRIPAEAGYGATEVAAGSLLRA